MNEDFLRIRIAQLRMQKGVSARDMSLSMGQADNYINCIENKKMLPSMTMFFEICHYLGVTPTEFFNDKLTNPGLMNEAIKELETLDDTALLHILGLVKGLRGKK